MGSRALFTTLLYEAELDAPFVEGLADACRSQAESDKEGRMRARAAIFSGYRGYTTHGSEKDVTARDPRFADLARRLDAHVRAFCEDCAFDLHGRALKLNNMWINLLEPGGAHGSHMHPRSVVSGTVYVSVPPGSGPLKLEDPRLGMLMAAPDRRSGAPEALRTIVYVVPTPGKILLWESWLRHEVAPNTGAGERISISFNYS